MKLYQHNKESQNRKGYGVLIFLAPQIRQHSDISSYNLTSTMMHSFKNRSLTPRQSALYQTHWDYWYWVMASVSLITPHIDILSIFVGLVIARSVCCANNNNRSYKWSLWQMISIMDDMNTRQWTNRNCSCSVLFCCVTYVGCLYFITWVPSFDFEHFTFGKGLIWISGLRSFATKIWHYEIM